MTNDLERLEAISDKVPCVLNPADRSDVAALVNAFPSLIKEIRQLRNEVDMGSAETPYTCVDCQATIFGPASSDDAGKTWRCELHWHIREHDTLRSLLDRNEAALKIAENKIAGLRKYLHMREGHNQIFERCENRWCHPDGTLVTIGSRETDPALEPIGEIYFRNEAALVEARAERDRLRAELKVRSVKFVPTDWSNFYENGRGRTAYECGFATAWRGQDSKFVYHDAQRDYREAEVAGFAMGEKCVRDAIAKATAELEAGR